MTTAHPEMSARERRRQARLPNRLLRRARLSQLSPSGSGRPLSRQELAEAVNAHIYTELGRVTSLNSSYIGRLERGQHRWPHAHVRAGFRAVLGAGTDAELGFYIARRTADDDITATGASVAFVPRPPSLRLLPRDIQVFVNGCTAVVVMPVQHPLLALITEKRGSG